MLIVLTGTSSSGKTTLARAIVAAADRPMLHFEADRIVPALGLSSGLPDEYRVRFIRTLHEAIGALGRTLDVIVDGSLPNESILRDECIAILREVPGTRVIAVRCSTDELRRREATRQNRIAGWAEEQAQTLYDNQQFDLEVDTSELSVGDCARTVVELVFRL
jgi:chloramphenicol 3-O phosphotransferase